MTQPFPDLLRHWRGLRRFSQLALASEAGISQRHLSFLESGRARPSREMVGLLADTLELPLRDTNEMLTAAGFAAAFPNGGGEAAHLPLVQQLIDAHMPFPALAVDRHWTLVIANTAALSFLQGVAPELAASPINVLRLSLHPEGLAPRIQNLADWRAHLLHRLDRQIAASADPVLMELRAELAAYPAPASKRPLRPEAMAPCVTLRLAVPGGVLSLISTTTVFGAPLDVGLSELAIETFLPADPATAAALGAGTAAV